MATQKFQDLHPLAKIAAVIMTTLLAVLAVGIVAIILGLVYKAALAVWS